MNSSVAATITLVRPILSDQWPIMGAPTVRMTAPISWR